MALKVVTKKPQPTTTWHGCGLHFKLLSCKLEDQDKIHHLKSRGHALWVLGAYNSNGKAKGLVLDELFISPTHPQRLNSDPFSAWLTFCGKRTSMATWL